MNKSELKNEVGEKGFFADENSLAGKLIYISGINEFDNELKGSNQFERGEVIHFEEMPKGLIVSLAKNFSSIKYGIPFSKIASFSLSTFEYYSVIEIKTNDAPLFFVLKNTHKNEVVNFLKKFNPSKSFDEVKLGIPTKNTGKIEDILLRHTYLIPLFNNDIKASKIKRALNFIIDHLIIVIPYLILLFPDFNNYQSSTLFVLILLYYLFFEGLLNTTVGKLITRTRIVSSNGTEPENIFVRTLARFIPLSPLSFIFFENGWHDKISNTQVIDLSKREILLMKRQKVIKNSF